jgi:hypothetical protein
MVTHSLLHFRCPHNDGGVAVVFFTNLEQEEEEDISKVTLYLHQIQRKDRTL